MHLYENIASRKRYVNRSTNTILRLMISKHIVEVPLKDSKHGIYVFFKHAKNIVLNYVVI